MVFDNLTAQEVLVEVEVDFGSGNAFVPQHLLYGTQVGTILEQVRGKGVSQGVGAHTLRYATKLASIAHNVENHGATEATATAVEKKKVLLAGLDIEQCPHGKVVFNLGNGLLRDGHQPQLAALALDTNIFIAQIELRQAQTHQLRDPQSATIHHLDNGAIALSLVT